MPKKKRTIKHPKKRKLPSMKVQVERLTLAFRDLEDRMNAVEILVKDMPQPAAEQPSRSGDPVPSM